METNLQANRAYSPASSIANQITTAGATMIAPGLFRTCPPARLPMPMPGQSDMGGMNAIIQTLTNFFAQMMKMFEKALSERANASLSPSPAPVQTPTPTPTPAPAPAPAPTQTPAPAPTGTTDPGKTRDSDKPSVDFAKQLADLFEQIGTFQKRINSLTKRLSNLSRRLTKSIKLR